MLDGQVGLERVDVALPEHRRPQLDAPRGRLVRRPWSGAAGCWSGTAGSRAAAAVSTRRPRRRTPGDGVDLGADVGLGRGGGVGVEVGAGSRGHGRERPGAPTTVHFRPVEDCRPWPATPPRPAPPSTSRVLALLGAFDERHLRLTLTELAGRAALPVPTAHRLVGELVAWGALARTPAGDYVVGRRLWDLGLLAPVQSGLREIASPFLHDLYGATLATVHLAVRDGTEVLYLDRLAGHASVPVVSSVGSRLPHARHRRGQGAAGPRARGGAGRRAGPADPGHAVHGHPARAAAPAAGAGAPRGLRHHHRGDEPGRLLGRGARAGTGTRWWPRSASWCRRSRSGPGSPAHSMSRPAGSAGRFRPAEGADGPEGSTTVDCRHANPGRHHRRGPGRRAPVPPARRRGRRVRGHRDALGGVRREPDPRRHPGAVHRRPAPGARTRRAPGRRGRPAPRHVPAVAGRAAPPRLRRPGRPLGVGLRPDRGAEGPRRRRPTRAASRSSTRSATPPCTTSRRDRPSVTFTDKGGSAQRVEADVVVGCDGSFGPSRTAVPEAVRRTWERTYPYSWLGILADVAPSTDELIYAWHPDGFALHSMRSSAVSRFYLQVPNDTDLADWSDDRIWQGLADRLGHGQDGWSAGHRADHRAERAADALLRAAADAARPALPRRRRRAHRAAHRRQGPQPRGRRRRAARAGPRRAAARRPPPRRRLLRHRAAAGVAVHALLVVDDDHAAHRRRPVRRTSCSCPSCAGWRPASPARPGWPRTTPACRSGSEAGSVRTGRVRESAGGSAASWRAMVGPGAGGVRSLDLSWETRPTRRAASACRSGFPRQVRAGGAGVTCGTAGTPTNGAAA